MFHSARAQKLTLACALYFTVAGFPAFALESTSTTLYRNRSSVDSGGVRKTSSGAFKYRADASAGVITVSTGLSPTLYHSRDGWMGVAYQPARITDLWASSGTVPSEIQLQWTAPGNDGDEATTAGSFVIKYTSVAANAPGLSNANFEAASVVPVSAPAPGPRGTRHQLTITGLSGGVTYYFSVKTGERDGVRALLSAGATALTIAPAPTAPALFSVGLSSAGLSYGTVGANGYVVQASTAADFTGTLYSSSTLAQASVLVPQNLDPNTTYYLRAGALWNTATSYASVTPSTSTLATAVSGTQVGGVWATSVTINWIALPVSPSSKTAEGYVLWASTAADFTGSADISSFTPNVALSTLTIANLYGGTTYYFRVASLNWNSRLNYAATVSTTLLHILSISISDSLVDMGTLFLGNDVVISTRNAVTNTGNVRETYSLRATTTTAGSPWQISGAPGYDQFALYTVFNSTQPSLGDFLSGDRVGETNATSSGSIFTMGPGGGDQTGVAVPIDGVRNLWFRFAMPTGSTTRAQQNIAVTVTAEEDP